MSVSYRNVNVYLDPNDLTCKPACAKSRSRTPFGGRFTHPLLSCAAVRKAAKSACEDRKASPHVVPGYWNLAALSTILQERLRGSLGAFDRNGCGRRLSAGTEVQLLVSSLDQLC